MEESQIIEVIKAARTVQDFLWGELNKGWGLEEWKRMFRKRVAKIDEITTANPHYKIELRKRLLQTAAISIALMTKLDDPQFELIEGIHIEPLVESNLKEYGKKE